MCSVALCSLSFAAVDPVTLDVGQTRFLSVPSVLSVVNTHPSVIAAERYSNREIRIEAKYPGEAYVHVFNYDNKVSTIKVIVRGKKAPLAETAGAGPGGQYSMYFKRDADADYPVNRWMHTHEVLVHSPTALGQNITKLQYKAQMVATNDMRSQVAYFSTRFRGVGHALIVGDDTLSYSELMAPALTYQGVRAQLFALDDVLDVDVFVGDKGNKHWGEQVRDDVSAFQEVYGAKLSWKATSKLRLTSAFLSQYDWDMRGSDKRLNARSVGAQYQYDPYLLFSGEVASSVRKAEAFSAVRAQSIWQSDTLMLDCTVRDLTSGYESVSNWLDYRGQQGVYLRTRYRPTSSWSLWGAFDRFLKRFPLEYLNQDYYGERNRVTVALHRIAHVAPSIALFNNNGHNNRWYGATMRLSQIDILGEWATLYYEFSPSVYDDDTLVQNSYDLQQGVAGISIRPVRLVEVRLENEYEYYIYNAGYRDDPRGNNIIFNYGVFPLFWTDIQTIFSLRYQERHNSERTTDQVLYSGSLQLRDSITADLSWYLRLVGVSQHIKHYDWELADYEYDTDPVRSEVAGGMSYTF